MSAQTGTAGGRWARLASRGANPWGRPRFLVAVTWGYVLWALLPVAIAILFSSFSSPFLSAMFTIGIFLLGRSSDTLANLPARSFGEPIRQLGQALARVVPNLHVYVPARPLLLGQVPGTPVWPYVGVAAAHALFYTVVVLCLGALVFRKRDFQ